MKDKTKSASGGMLDKPTEKNQKELWKELGDKTKSLVHSEIVELPFLVKYYDNGKIDYVNPSTEKIMFTIQHPSGKSPVVKTNPREYFTHYYD